MAARKPPVDLAMVVELAVAQVQDVSNQASAVWARLGACPPSGPAGYGTIPGSTGLHAAASIDRLMQLSGDAVFVLEDAEVRLAPGDWLIVNGVTHSWRNDRDEPAVMAGVIIGAEHKGVPLRKR